MGHDELSLNLDPHGYDAHGLPMYDDDLLDVRWRVFLDDAAALLGHSEMLDIETGAVSIRCIEDTNLRRQAIEILTLMVDRELQREASPNLLSVEEGAAWRRRLDVDALRAHGQRYVEVATRAGWPADPNDLDEKQMDQALLVVVHPELLEDVLRGRFDED